MNISAKVLMGETKEEEMKAETLLEPDRNNDYLKRKKYKILKNILLISLVFLLNFTSFMVSFLFFLFDLFINRTREQPCYLNQGNRTCLIKFCYEQILQKFFKILKICLLVRVTSVQCYTKFHI